MSSDDNNDEPTLEDLAKLQDEARERIDEERPEPRSDRPPARPLDAEELTRGLVQKSDDEIAELERRERADAAPMILDRLPAHLRVSKPETLRSYIASAKLVTEAARWLPEGSSLLLVGGTGRGKTSAAAYLFRRLLGRGVKNGGEDWRIARGLQWYPATELDRARSEHPLGKGDAPAMVAACRATVLFLDDLGWDRDPKAVSHVLDARYNAGLVTVATTSRRTRGINGGPSELDRHYDGAVMRRFMRAGGRGAVIVEAE